MTIRRRRSGPAVAAALLAALLTTLAGCGDSGGDGEVATAGGDPEPSESAADADADEQALEFAECMRDNGIDMPDPAPGTEGLMEAVNELEGAYDEEALTRAFDACADRLPTTADGGESPAAIDEEVMLEHTQCLRDQGIDVSDDPMDAEQFENADPDALAEALEHCREIFSGGDRTDGDGQ